MTSLQELNLQSTSISGTVSGNIGESVIELLLLDISKISGISRELPSSLGSLSKMRNLFASYTEFSGVIPDSFSSMTVLQTSHVGE